MYNLPSILYTFPKILTRRIFLISISLLNSQLWNNEVFINISVLKLFSQKNLEPNGGFSLLNMIVQSVHLICRVIENFLYVVFADSFLSDVLCFDHYNKYLDVLDHFATDCVREERSIMELIFWFIPWSCGNHICCEHERSLCSI